MKPIERVEIIIKNEGLSISAFEKATGMSNNSIQTAIKRKSNLKDDTLNSILIKFKHINPSWLLTGEGVMLRSGKTLPNSLPNTLPNPKKTVPNSNTLEEPPVTFNLSESFYERIIKEKENTIEALNETIATQKQTIDVLLNPTQPIFKDKTG
jgi:hypothetical protein